MLIRDAMLEEAQLVLELWRTAFEDEDARGDLGDVARIILDDHGARLLLAALDGRLVGALIVTFDGWRGHMYRLAVLAEHRHKGIASALVREAEAWLRAVGCHRVRLTAVQDNHAGTSFWHAMGYVTDSQSYVRAL